MFIKYGLHLPGLVQVMIFGLKDTSKFGLRLGCSKVWDISTKKQALLVCPLKENVLRRSDIIKQ